MAAPECQCSGVQLTIVCGPACCTARVGHRADPISSKHRRFAIANQTTSTPSTLISSRGRPKMAQKSFNYHEYNNGINTVLWECIPLLYYGYNYKAKTHLTLPSGCHVLTRKA